MPEKGYYCEAKYINIDVFILFLKPYYSRELGIFRFIPTKGKHIKIKELDKNYSTT